MTAHESIPGKAISSSHPLWRMPFRLAAALRRAAELRRDRRRLVSLSDHILRDIGIDRFEIRSITACRGEDGTRRSRTLTDDNQ